MSLTRFNYCSASMRGYNEWLGAERDAQGRCACPLCGKTLLLRKNNRGWRTIIPTHIPAPARAGTS